MHPEGAERLAETKAVGTRSGSPEPLRVDGDQSLRLLAGQRAQQDTIGDAEDRGVGADAERQCHDGDLRQSGLLRY